MKPTTALYALALSTALLGSAAAKELATVKDAIRFVQANPHQVLTYNDTRVVLHPSMNVVIFLLENEDRIQVARFHQTDKGEIYLTSMDPNFLNRGPLTASTLINAHATDVKADLPILKLLDAFAAGPMNAFRDIPAGSRFEGNHTLRLPNDQVGTWEFTPEGKAIRVQVADLNLDAFYSVEEFTDVQ